jgi:hypothetical protein
MVRYLLEALGNTYDSWNIPTLVRRWRKNKRNHDNDVSEGVVRAMETLENALVREVNDLTQQIQQVENLGQLIKGKRGTPSWAALEKSYQDNSWSAAASDSKTHIQCIVNRVIQFTRSRKFYQLGEAIDDAISQIEKHYQHFPAEILEDNIFTALREGLNAQRNSLNTLKNALENLTTTAAFNERTDKRQLKIWAEHLERLGEELEDNLELFSSEFFDALERVCETIVLTARKKATNRKNRSENKREEWRRRVRYAAGFILNLIEMAREDAIQEDEEVIHDFFVASQSSFESVWEDEGERWNTI